jgi:thioredoxin reductase (NADPH)
MPPSVLVVGSGMAGLSAALWAARFGLAPVVLEGVRGGVMTTAARVEDFPGAAEAEDGTALAERMRAQAEVAGARFEQRSMHRLLASPLAVELDGGGTMTADAIVLALGGRAARLGVPGEELLRGYGVSECATCDGFFNVDKHCVIVGGGDTAFEDAIVLTEYASRVTLVHRGDAPTAAAVLVARARAHEKIAILPHRTVIAVAGAADATGVTGVTVRDERSGEETPLPCGALYVAVGREPATERVRGAVALDARGYVVRPDGWSTATTTPGVFAAGECTDPTYRQALTAAAMGCMAAHDARRFIDARRLSRGNDVARD